ncbi:MAG TPA: LysM domain-containing protein [Chloroflexota bacterium]|nr:LysM domain-containing protein [Chloroflexota bacterium]
MPSRTTRTPGQSAIKQPEVDEAYPQIPEPKQSHTGSLLAFVSVLAVLGFGFWTALTTYMGPGDGKATAKPTATAAATARAATTPAAVSAATAVSSTPSAGSSGTPAAGATATGASGSRVHVVGDGDTLYKIATRYGTTVDAIVAANGFPDRGKVLHVGDRITIP